ncbi:preprotein translocase subunit SecG [Sphingobium sp. JS3065]|jgi:preprotein translocase subunit SecG|uniref:preprotein translocase subunit SecG n=1 Tax=Sphingobium sp. JS3065 TaxID=2970925 RepID=UPI0022653684|nr:preprotein translocase subunit SecG [Sphingobium sp. JS3065]UZW55731.1 preprotein translocase subunit SecG [Sphingobium sp. JS3065]
MFTFILVVQAIVAALLVTVILMQKSEGGGLGVGGSPAGFMSARGAADFLTRSTTILAGIFVTLSVVLAVIASVQHRPSDIDTSLVKQAPQTPAGAPATAPAPATGSDPLAGAAGSNGAVPLAN